MGSSANVSCAACGYTAVVTIGGGMDTYKVFLGWPVRCDGCRSVATANLREKPIKCLSCNSCRVVPYGEIRVPMEWKSGGESPMFECFEHVYYEKTHECPRCLKKSLKFNVSRTILFD